MFQHKIPHIYVYIAC